MKTMTAIILAGGKSSRMGRNKALLKIEGTSFIERQIALLHELFDDIIISANTPSEYAFLPIPVIKDLYPEKGPLGGIYTGLIESSSPYTFFLACDMPFVELPLIRHLKGLTSGVDAVVPKSERGLEPLHAFYSKKCIEPIKKALDHSNLRIISFFSEVSVKIVELDSLSSSQTLKESITNLNTRDDYESAKKRIGKRNLS
ncbi:MAG: molybdenum cofactor guanylyltransferase [Candidatus Scalindua sp. SCAELEC01]|nr:molybdenum cofactor guanylyltransferase [Planctomycetota bacterium]RZV92371.1 MAG: molybdenum cofactor guanylyltransferase [Candidatus Scalindua sp. SCAELEC01]